MSSGAFGVEPFSTEVVLTLETERGETIPLAQVGDSFVIAARPCTLPACTGTVVVSVNGVRHEQRVSLPNGLNADAPQAEAIAADDQLPF